MHIWDHSELTLYQCCGQQYLKKRCSTLYFQLLLLYMIWFILRNQNVWYWLSLLVIGVLLTQVIHSQLTILRTCNKIMLRQFFSDSDEFVTSAGAVLFRNKPHQLEMCLIRRKEEWLPPKGCKDRGQSVEETALREIYETATVPMEGFKLDKPDQPLVFALSIDSIPSRGDTDNRNIKLIHWFIFTVCV